MEGTRLIRATGSRRTGADALSFWYNEDDSFLAYLMMQRNQTTESRSSGSPGAHVNRKLALLLRSARKHAAALSYGYVL